MRFLKKELRIARGFTFIEMLVVLVLLATLMSVVMVRLNKASVSSRDKKRLVDLRMIQSALSLYYSDWDAYPGSLSFGGKLEDSNGRTYMAEVPTDPEYPKKNYYYQTLTAGYVICAAMEDDKNIPAAGSIYYPPATYSCGNVNCNYCLQPL